MSWIEFSANANVEAIDWIRTLLATVDYSDDLIVENSNLSMPATQNTDVAAEWPFSVYLYWPNNTQTRSQVDTILELLSPLERTRLINQVEVTLVEEKPIHLMNQSGHRVGSFVVVDSQAEYHPNEKEVILKLEQSLAFGSGLHPATQLSLKLIERYVQPTMTVLDLGCGSGILSVAMAKLGAEVLAIDNDAVAVKATQAAVSLNHVTSHVTVMQASLGQGQTLGHWMGEEIDGEVETLSAIARFDVIVANILGRIHLTLVNEYRKALHRTPNNTGILITAGYTNDYQEEVSTAFAQAGFEEIAQEQSNEWIAFAHGLPIHRM